MRISVVTVTLNSAATLEDTLISVRAQTGIEVEHIIVDGGSTDGTLALVDRYRDRLGPCISERDSGIYNAMNKGLALATGEYIGFLNSDDYFASPDVLSSVARKSRAGQMDCLCGDIVIIDSGRRPLRYMRSRSFRPSLLTYGVSLPHPAFYMRTDLLREMGGFAEQYRIASDFDLILRLFARARLRFESIDKLLAVMRVGGASSAGWASTQKATREIADILNRHGTPRSQTALRLRYLPKALEIAHGGLLRMRGNRYEPPSAE